MGYQELITSYENKGLDITSLKEMLEIAKPLKGRLKYRAIDIIAQRSGLLNDINNLLIISEKPDKITIFEQDVNNILNNYFLSLTKNIKSAKAWKFMKLNSEEYTLEIFEKLSKKEQFKTIYFLNEKYLEFLGYQNIADIRDCLDNAKGLDDEIIGKLEFLRQMFSSLKNKEVKVEFFCFDKSFLQALIDFRKSKSFKLEDYMKTKRKKSRNEYKKFLQFFSNEDFRDIAENLDLARKTLKVPANSIIEAYSEMSESEAEVYYIEEEFKSFKKLEEKYNKMQVVKAEYEKIKAKLEKEIIEREKKEELARKEAERKLAEEEKKRELEKIAESIKVIKTKKAEKEDKTIKEEVVKEDKIEKEKKTKKTEKIEKTEKLEKVGKNEKSKKSKKKEIEPKEEKKEEIIEKIEEKIQEELVDEIYFVPKEQVNPLIFSWLERENVTLTKKIGSKKLAKFFDRIKEIEERTGIRVSLYLVSNTGKEVTLKRLKDFKKKAIQNDLPYLVEGALGGYSSFRINSNEEIEDIFEMSASKREEIINLLEETKGVALTKDLIDTSEESYIRYDLTNKKDKNITKRYLNLIVGKLLKNEKISTMSLKFLTFMEGKAAGIDVILEGQLKGISQISEYYKEKYSVAPGKIMNTRIEDIDNFINEEQAN